MSTDINKNTTHFGFQTIPYADKEIKVSEIFHKVASTYDQMNDILSFGIHRLWKRFTIELSHIRPGHHVLDLAAGSGDVSSLIYPKLKNKGQLILADINASMLKTGRDRLFDRGMHKNIDYVQANAENLPFVDNYFHCILCAFGLRNVTNQKNCLQSLFRICKPGGKIMILEFSKPIIPFLEKIYDWYSFNIMPQIGQIIANDAESYQYLAESIRMHPDQNTLKNLIEESGFEDCNYYNLTFGIVSLHIAYKY